MSKHKPFLLFSKSRKQEESEGYDAEWLQQTEPTQQLWWIIDLGKNTLLSR